MGTINRLYCAVVFKNTTTVSTRTTRLVEKEDSTSLPSISTHTVASQQTTEP